MQRDWAYIQDIIDSASEPQENVTVRLINQKVRFSGISSSNPDKPITFDYVPPIGDGE